jgi:hypothetical protein
VPAPMVLRARRLAIRLEPPCVLMEYEIGEATLQRRIREVGQAVCWWYARECLL